MVGVRLRYTTGDVCETLLILFAFVEVVASLFVVCRATSVCGLKTRNGMEQTTLKVEQIGYMRINHYNVALSDDKTIGYI